MPDPNPKSLPDPISQIGSTATNVGNLIPDKVNSAIASAKTLVNQGLHDISKGYYSVGTKSACIGYGSTTDCMNFSLSTKLPSSFQNIASIVPQLKRLTDYLNYKPSLEAILIAGLTFNIASTLAYTPVYIFPKLRFISAGLSLLSVALFGAFVGLTLKIVDFATEIGKGGTVQHGAAYSGAIWSTTFSAIHGFISIIGIFVKYSPDWTIEQE
jgi:hypothetical protein